MPRDLSERHCQRLLTIGNNSQPCSIIPDLQFSSAIRMTLGF